MSREYEDRDMDNRLDETDAATTTQRSSSNRAPDASSTLDGTESEDDNEIEIELTIEYMTNGQSDMEAEDYIAAEENFRAALELAEEHDFSKTLGYGPGDITLVLADCLMKQEKEEEALEVLEPIADGSVSRHHSDVDSLRAGSVVDGCRDQITQYRACHILGITFLKRMDYNAAEKRAQQAFKGRRKVCGPQDPFTLESVQLLIDIYTAKDDKTKARAYRRFLEPGAKSRPSVGGESLTNNSSVLPVQSADMPPAVTATLASPLLTALAAQDAAVTPFVPAALQTRKLPQTPPQAFHSATASTSSRGLPSPSDQLPQIVEHERLTIAPRVVEMPTEQSSSELFDSKRAAVPSIFASSARTPSPPSRESATSALPSAASANSASKAALSSVFASPEPKPVKVIDQPSAANEEPTVPAQASTATALQPLVSAPAPVTPIPQLPTTTKKTDPTPAPAPGILSARQPTTETPPPVDTSQKEDLAPPPRSFSWLTDTKFSVPSSAAKVASPPTTMSLPSDNPPAFAQPDPMPSNIGTSVTTKRRGWSLPFGRSKTDANSKKSGITPPSVAVPGSAATSFTAFRSPSATTVLSAAEPKRYMSLAGSTSSAQTNFFSKEYSYDSEKSPRPSISSTSTHPPSRTRQELAPRFAAIKAMRSEGKKSASIDAAMKLLREYDPDKKVLIVREAELKKNMKEGHKGLASTGHGYAPIHLFCERKTQAAVEVEILIEQGVDVNAVACKAGMPGHDPFTPLQRAVEHGHTDIVRHLVEADVVIAPPKLQKGAAATAGSKDAITQPLLIACMRGFTEITFVLLRAGAAKLLKEFPSRQWHGNSLLHEACWLADTVMVKMLLDYLKTIRAQYHSSAGPDYESGIIGAPGQQDQFGATPIMYAIDLRDCTSDRMRMQKSQRRKDCLRLLLEHGIHGDLHSQTYRENIARVLSTKWTRGPGKGHSIFCYCDEAGDEELTRLLDPFRYQVAPNMRCHATPPCSTFQGSSIRNGSIRSGGTDRQAKAPEFAELMSAPVAWPPSNGAHFELADNSDPPPSAGPGLAASTSPATATSHRHGNGFTSGLSELTSETSR